MGENGSGDGICRQCKGTGYERVKPGCLPDPTRAPTFEVPGPLMTTPQKKGPLIVPGAR
jgi:hypothetical protein